MSGLDDYQKRKEWLDYHQRPVETWRRRRGNMLFVYCDPNDVPDEEAHIHEEGGVVVMHIAGQTAWWDGARPYTLMKAEMPPTTGDE